MPDGGWLDGALGVMAALGVLESWAASGEQPPRDLVLIDFADEEGARFGRSLFGSSALAGTLEPAELADLHDAGGETIGAVLAANGVELERAPEAHERLGAIGSYLELHIEQGPVLEAEGTSCAAVSGCAGVERHLLTFRGQASHAGTTPMDARRDAGLAAAEAALAIEAVANRHGGVGNDAAGSSSQPGVITAVAGGAELSVDLRHPECRAAGRHALRGARRVGLGSPTSAAACSAAEPIWRIAPIPFDPDLVEHARGGLRRAPAGGPRRSRAAPSTTPPRWPAGFPTAMIFCASRDGISHAQEEDSAEADLLAGIEAFGALVAAAL